MAGDLVITIAKKDRSAVAIVGAFLVLLVGLIGFMVWVVTR